MNYGIVKSGQFGLWDIVCNKSGRVVVVWLTVNEAQWTVARYEKYIANFGE